MIEGGEQEWVEVVFLEETTLGQVQWVRPVTLALWEAEADGS